MDVNDLHPPDDYSHRFFIWHEWIQANGPLVTENVFDYFATSMFYDKQSNNQVLRMQTMHTGIPIANEAEELRRFTGIEFALVHAQPPSFFIIHKRERLSPDEVRPLSAYFIVHNRIYQSPDVYSILSNRLLTAVHSLQASLDVLRKHRPDYTPRTGFVWPIADPSLSDDASKTRKQDPDATVPEQENLTGEADKHSRNTRREQNNMLLVNAMRTTAAHSKLSFTSITAEAADTGAVSDIPASSQLRSSATPAPGSQETVTKGVTNSINQPQEPSKGPAGGGKKKKKRTSMAAPSAPT
ncbi:MED6-domain-containing protein [Macrolepiota fuliginosa MF-IS2]|uniref:Mediator of RNA polymerase II transcription subunit 6 n=1 Tax=Macrolepiota fuliginosa MF-IS2 TaxID=1400762 RepID=A0A9P6C559_9AGAR|nr:MED6-domain-containing protein [Macrolepiota fuliginosa MF-IS2]